MHRKRTNTSCLFYKMGQDFSYKKIYDGKWRNESPYGVVHRLASKTTQKGCASFCLSWALEQCGNLKIDTHRDNKVMQNLLKKNGFSYCGIICLNDAVNVWRIKNPCKLIPA